MKRNNVKQLTLRLTAEEYAHIRQLSQNSGLKMEPAIRRMIMGVNLRPRPPDELPELLRQLSGIGTNEVYSVSKISVDDTSVLDDSTENIITLVTCVMDQPDYRWCVQAREK